MAEAKKRTTKAKVESSSPKSVKKETTKARAKTTTRKTSTRATEKLKAEPRSKTSTTTRNNGTSKNASKSTRTVKKEDKSCTSCKFRVTMKRVVEGKEVSEHICCFHWPMSETDNMEKDCSLYIGWKGNLHGCK